MALPAFLRRPSLVTQIVIALVVGTLVGVAWPAAGAALEIVGTAFVEALKATYPYYAVRLLGGVLYLSGMLIMAYNTWKTIFLPQRESEPVRAAAQQTA